MTSYNSPNLCQPVWDISGGSKCANNDSDYAAALAAEQLEIAGATINVYRLLGVHEQGKLIDLTGIGNPISSGTSIGSVLSNVYINNAFSWKSAEIGTQVLNSFLGYNFGTIKTSYGAEKYAPSQPVLENITTIRIKQGAQPNRVSQVRIENSNDGGVSWSRVDVVNLPDTSNQETISIKQSSPAQLWRLVPTIFNGGPTDNWEVERLEMMDYTQTRLDNIEDKVLLENRDRDYSVTPIILKGTYDLLDVSTEFSKFGIDIPQQFIFVVSFAKMVEKLGRPVVIGDIIELPSETQYDTNLHAVKKWLEVEDTAWDTQGFTPGWKPVLFRITTSPLIASSQTRDIIGVDNNILNIDDADFLSNQIAINNTAQTFSDSMSAEAKTNVPETGIDSSEITQPDNNQILAGAHESMPSRGLYIEDGIPPNGLPYTEGFTMPSNPSAGDYHRLMYDPSYDIPTKLFKWNMIKNRWIFQENDTRNVNSSFKPSVDNMISSTTKRDLG